MYPNNKLEASFCLSCFFAFQPTESATFISLVAASMQCAAVSDCHAILICYCHCLVTSLACFVFRFNLRIQKTLQRRDLFLSVSHPPLRLSYYLFYSLSRCNEMIKFAHAKCECLSFGEPARVHAGQVVERSGKRATLARHTISRKF